MDRPVVSFALACLAVLPLTAVPASAQEELELELFRPRIDVSLEGAGDADFSDMPGTFKTNLVSLSANIPLGTTHVRPDKKTAGYQFFLQTQLGTRSPEISFLNRDHRLYDGSVRGAALLARKSGSLVLLTAGVSFAEDDETKSSIDPRVYGAGLATWRKNDHLLFVYGAGVSFQYGEQLALPLLGLVWLPDSNWSLTTILPFLVRATYDASDRLKLHLLLTPAGNRYRFANEGNFPGQSETVYLRATEVRIGAELEYAATHDLSLLFQAGVAGARTLEFDDGSDPFLSADIDGASYLRLAARFRFGKSLLDEVGF